MRIVIPTNDNHQDSTTSSRFGRAPYLAAYDSLQKNWSFYKNPGESNTGGAGIKAAQWAIDIGCESLIVDKLGSNAADMLKAADVKLYKMVDGRLVDLVLMAEKETLPRLNDFHEGFHNHGGQ